MAYICLSGFKMTPRVQKSALRFPTSTPRESQNLPQSIIIESQKPKIEPQTHKKKTTPKGRKINSQRPRTDTPRLKSNSEMAKIALQMLKIESQKAKFD